MHSCVDSLCRYVLAGFCFDCIESIQRHVVYLSHSFSHPLLIHHSDQVRYGTELPGIPIYI
jgi:hypothetical protein